MAPVVAERPPKSALSERASIGALRIVRGSVPSRSMATTSSSTASARRPAAKLSSSSSTCRYSGPGFHAEMNPPSPPILWSLNWT